MWWPETTHIYSLTAPEVLGLEALEVNLLPYLLQLLELHSLPFLAGGPPSCPFKASILLPGSQGLPLLWQISLCFLLRRTHVMAFRAHPVNPR